MVWEVNTRLSNNICKAVYCRFPISVLFVIKQLIVNTVSPLDNISTLADTPFSADSYRIQASLGISKNLVLGGWAGYTNARNLTTSAAFPDRGEAETWNWAVTLGLPDLGKKGNLAPIETDNDCSV